MAAAKRNAIRFWVAGVLYGILVIGYAAYRVPTWLLVLYSAMSLLSIATYWFDKRASIQGAWRVRENTLHLLDLFGGVIGGLAAQEVFRHKTYKPGFVSVTWFIAALHFTFLAVAVTGFLPLAKLGLLIVALRGAL
jgi:uncharacterized membrane protein YsdA (DUF1294 family)